MSLKIDDNTPGGNIIVGDINGFDITLAKDLRDTEGEWFYWCFRAVFDETGLYSFHFTNGYACGARGPAASYDGGLSWEWLGAECVTGEKRENFTYFYDGRRGNSVIFCVSMQYQMRHLEQFLERHANSGCLTVSTLAYTRKNRPVQILHLEDREFSVSKKYIFLSSRHHCCEMTATYALEGILESFLKDDDLGRELRSRYIIDAVPFVDTDGVLDGDQGKNRRPHDHNRDYGECPLYPEVAAVKELLSGRELFFMLDMHSPWLFCGDSETIYFPGPEDKEYEKRMLLFSEILEKNSPPSALHHTADNVLFGTLWNTGKNYASGSLTAAEWCRRYCKPAYANTMEIPYANAGEKTFTADVLRALGRAIARSIIGYDNQLYKTRCSR